MNGIAPHVRALLQCPKCRAALTDDDNALVCDACSLRYPVVDGVPHLVVERAKKSKQRP